MTFNLIFHKNKLYKTLSYWSRDTSNFNFSEKGLELVSPPYSTYDFSRKMFLMLHSINWPNFIVWFLLLLEICALQFCYSGCDVIKFEINIIFLINPFCHMTKMSRQKLKHLENRKSFLREIKTIFNIFKGLSATKNCLWPESAPINGQQMLT